MKSLKFRRCPLEQSLQIFRIFIFNFKTYSSTKMLYYGLDMLDTLEKQSWVMF